MGLKSGSRDAGLDEEDEEQHDSTEDENPATEQPPDDSATTEASGGDDPTAKGHEETARTSGSPSGSSAEHPSMDSIPYKLRRDKVNEGREQVPYFLRDHVIEAEDELQATLEELLGENVYKSDYREAAMVVAQRNPELVAEILREWGYDLD